MSYPNRNGRLNDGNVWPLPPGEILPQSVYVTNPYPEVANAPRSSPRAKVYIRDDQADGRNMGSSKNRPDNSHDDHHNPVLPPLPPFTPHIHSPTRNLQQKSRFYTSSHARYRPNNSDCVDPYQAFDEPCRYPILDYVFNNQREFAAIQQRVDAWADTVSLSEDRASHLAEMVIPRSHGCDSLHRRRTVTYLTPEEEARNAEEFKRLEESLARDQTEHQKDVEKGLIPFSDPESRRQALEAEEATQFTGQERQTPRSQTPNRRGGPSQNSAHSNHMIGRLNTQVPFTRGPNSQESAKFDHISVLRDIDVPFVSRTNQRNESFGKNATGTLLQNLSIDGVNSGGYPVPTQAKYYQEMISDVSPSSHQFPPHLLQSPTPRSSTTLYAARPRSMDALQEWRMASINFDNGMLAEALTNSQNIINMIMIPNDIPQAYIHYNIGILQSRLQQYVFAEASFNAAVEIDPKLACAWYSLGVIRQKNGNGLSAQKAYDEALALFDGDTVISYHHVGLDLFLYKTVLNCDRDLCVRAFLEKYTCVRMFKTDAIFNYVEGVKEVVETVEIQEGAEREEEKSRGKLWKRIMRRLRKKKD